MKVIAMISGGLDSALAAKLMIDQGCEVVGFHCVHDFSRRKSRETASSPAQIIAQQLGISLHEVDMSREMIAIVKSPQHGYGSHANPCIDCRIISLRKAKIFMDEIGAACIVTGEVIGQRPMSQRLPVMRLIEKSAGVSGVVLRPLCQKLLPETDVEKSGSIDRNALLAISGRGRRQQMDLAKQFGIHDYLTPAGGCLLTNEGYARKVHDLIEYDVLTLENVRTLTLGRHFRINTTTKLMVGRDESDNMLLLQEAHDGDLVFEPPDEVRGPIALMRSAGIDEAATQVACGIVARYCDDAEDGIALRTRIHPTSPQDSLTCNPLDQERIESLRI